MPKKKQRRIEQIKKQTKTEAEKKAQEEKDKKIYWWETKRDRDERGEQEYDDEFFEPHFANLEPKIPDDYSDPIYDEEMKLMSTPTKEVPGASPTNLNVTALYSHYEKNIMPTLRDKSLVGICIPTGNGDMNINCAVAMNVCYKPRHRIHTVQGHNIGILRNMLVEMALRHRDTSHVFFLDSDTVIPPFTLIRMLRRDVPIVAGIYTMKVPPYVPLAIMRPLTKEGERKYNYYVNLKQELLNKVFPMDATGAGCLMIKKEVLIDMGPPWFQVTPQENGLSAIGEDLFFFDKAKDAGYDLLLDTSIQCDHVAGGVSYPQLFFQGHAAPGPRCTYTINTWNKNAVLHSLGLPFLKEPVQPLKKTVEGSASDKSEQPLAVEEVEVLSDAQKVRKDE